MTERICNKDETYLNDTLLRSGCDGKRVFLPHPRQPRSEQPHLKHQPVSQRRRHRRSRARLGVAGQERREERQDQAHQIRKGTSYLSNINFISSCCVVSFFFF